MQKTRFDWWDFKGRVFYPLELVCKVEYCRTEKQDGVMVVGLRISEVDVRVSIYSGKGVVCTKKVIKVLVYKNPPPIFSYSCVCCVRRLLCEHSELFLD